MKEEAKAPNKTRFISEHPEFGFVSDGHVKFFKRHVYDATPEEAARLKADRMYGVNMYAQDELTERFKKYPKQMRKWKDRLAARNYFHFGAPKKEYEEIIK